MKRATTIAIVLGSKNFMESDKIVHLYSEDLGKIRAIAKGARRITSKFVGHLETLNLVTASLYFGPKNTILTEITTIQNPLKTRDNLEILKSAITIAQITDRCVYENQIHKDLSTLITKTIKHLKKSKKPEIVTLAYTIKFLNLIGLVPNFKENPVRMQKKYLKFFNFIQHQPLDEIEKITLKDNEHKYIKSFIKELLPI